MQPVLLCFFVNLLRLMLPTTTQPIFEKHPWILKIISILLLAIHYKNFLCSAIQNPFNHYFYLFP